MQHLLKIILTVFPCRSLWMNLRKSDGLTGTLMMDTFQGTIHLNMALMMNIWNICQGAH